MRTAPSSPLHSGTLTLTERFCLICAIASFLASPVLEDSKVCHPQGRRRGNYYLFGSSAILKSGKMQIWKYNNVNHLVWPKSGTLSPTHPLSPAITRHAPLIRSVLQPPPLVLSGGDCKQQKTNLYSFAHLVCCCLLSIVWDRLLASRRQTLVHAQLLGCTKKVPRFRIGCLGKIYSSWSWTVCCHSVEGWLFFLKKKQ